MPDPTSLYPQPAQAAPQGGLLADPGKAVGLLQTLQSLQIQGAQAPALMQQPAAVLQGQNIGNASQQFKLDAAHNSWLADNWGALADKPSLSPEDVHNFSATAARAGIPPAKIIQFRDQLFKYKGGLNQAAKDFRGQAVGAAGTMTPEKGPLGPNAEPTVIRAGAANQGPASGFAVGQAPGEADVQAASAKRGSDLQATASTTAQYHSNLENLKQDSRVLDNLGGPTAEVEKKINQLSQRLGGFGITMTKEQLEAAESFDKIANQISLDQSKNFHGSDAGLHTVVGANPNLSMSRYGRDGVIDMLQGNQDAIDVTRKAWLDARKNGAPAHSYDTFVNEFSKVVDPRVFQFNRLSRDNQQKFLSQLDPSDLPEFETKYKDAIARKWVKPLKADKQSTLGGLPPVPGAKKASDGEWYLPDSGRPGKYLRVNVG